MISSNLICTPILFNQEYNVVIYMYSKIFSDYVENWFKVVTVEEELETDSFFEALQFSGLTEENSQLVGTTNE